MALVGVMLVLGILYIRHSSRADTGTSLSTVEASMASSGGPTTTTLFADGAAAADRIQVAGLGVGDSVTTLAPGESISLYAVAAKAAADSAAAAEVKARAATTTTVKKVAQPAATTTTVKKAVLAPTTTVAKPSTVAAVPAATTTTITATPGVYGSGQSDTGNASWFGATDGTCAHRTLPFGTIVKVTRIRTGATATCRVNDRGPSDLSRVIDLSDDVFASLAPMGAGLMPVKIEW